MFWAGFYCFFQKEEDRFRLLVQAQDEDRRAIRSLLGREGTPVAAPSIAHVPLMKMGPHDDPEAFVDPFEKTAEACGWARTQWPVRLFPPADGGGAGGSPTAACREPPGLRRPKAGHPATRRPKPRAATINHQRFRSVELGDCGRPFVMAQQLRDACRKWLMAEPRDVEGVIDLVVLEQFVARLPRRTAEWVQCHRPTSLAQAIQLAEDHMAACPVPSLSSPFPPISLSLSPCPSSQVTAAGGPSSPTAEREWPGGGEVCARWRGGLPLSACID